MTHPNPPYFVRTSWNNPGWYAVCYHNSTGTSTLLCEAPGQQTAHQIARAMSAFTGQHCPTPGQAGELCKK